MFHIKMIVQDVIKEQNENGHCIKDITNTIVHNFTTADFSLYPTKPYPEDRIKKQERLYDIRTNYKIEEINLCMKFQQGSAGDCWDKIISISVDCNDRVTELYIMNDNGKTLERYIY